MYIYIYIHRIRTHRECGGGGGGGSPSIRRRSTGNGAFIRKHSISLYLRFTLSLGPFNPQQDSSISLLRSLPPPPSYLLLHLHLFSPSPRTRASHFSLTHSLARSHSASLSPPPLESRSPILKLDPRYLSKPPPLLPRLLCLSFSLPPSIHSLSLPLSSPVYLFLLYIPAWDSRFKIDVSLSRIPLSAPASASKQARILLRCRRVYRLSRLLSYFCCLVLIACAPCSYSCTL